MRLALISPLGYQAGDARGSSEPAQIAGRSELDEGLAISGCSAPDANDDPLAEDDAWARHGKSSIDVGVTLQLLATMKISPD